MRSIWAVAINTVKQAFRLKIAAVFVILLIVLLPIMGFSMTGDGTAQGRLQAFVSYGLSLTSLLLCLFTIIVSVYSLTNDIKQKQIYMVLTKPIRRFELIFGKLLGVVILDIALLTVFSVLIYTIVIYTPRLSGASAEETAQLKNEFYTARASLTPGEVDVAGEVEKLYQKLDESGQLEQMYKGIRRANIIAELTRRVKLRRRAAAPGQELIWEFRDVKPLSKDESLFIRFKYEVSVNPPDLHVYSAWAAGDYRQVHSGKIETPIETFERKDLIRTFHEIEVSANVVAEDGFLSISFLNVPQLNNTVVIFPPDDGLEVLYKADTFGSNFIKAVFLILFRLVFLACLGLMASSFLSMPVAILLCLLIFFTGTISGFIIESFEYLSKDISLLYSYTVGPMVKLLPQFDKFNPTKFLVSGRLLSWSLFARVGAVMVCIKSVLLLLLALLFFSYREIAKAVIR